MALMDAHEEAMHAQAKQLGGESAAKECRVDVRYMQAMAEAAAHFGRTLLDEVKAERVGNMVGTREGWTSTHAHIRTLQQTQAPHRPNPGGWPSMKPSDFCSSKTRWRT